MTPSPAENCLEVGKRKLWIRNFFFVPMIMTMVEWSKAIMRFGRIRIRLGVIYFRVFRLFL